MLVNPSWPSRTTTRPCLANYPDESSLWHVDQLYPIENESPRWIPNVTSIGCYTKPSPVMQAWPVRYQLTFSKAGLHWHECQWAHCVQACHWAVSIIDNHLQEGMYHWGGDPERNQTSSARVVQCLSPWLGICSPFCDGNRTLGKFSTIAPLDHIPEFKIKPCKPHTFVRVREKWYRINSKV